MSSEIGRALLQFILALIPHDSRQTRTAFHADDAPALGNNSSSFQWLTAIALQPIHAPPPPVLPERTSSGTVEVIVSAETGSSSVVSRHAELLEPRPGGAVSPFLLVDADEQQLTAALPVTLRACMERLQGPPTKLVHPPPTSPSLIEVTRPSDEMATDRYWRIRRALLTIPHITT